MMPTREFDDACRAFTASMHRTMGWQHNYFGAAYTTRLKNAVLDAEAAIVEIKRVIEEDSK